MDFYEKFKRFLGLGAPLNQPPIRGEDRWEPPDASHEEFEPPFRSFNLFTDPLEIHKYFEQQMGEMLKNFGFQDIPIEEEPGIVAPGELRDQFLKPGYEKEETKVDQDIDGSLDIRDWGSVFRGDSSRQLAPKSNFYGQSVTMKTVRNPDGSVETHHTVRDSAGNEETKITKKVGDKEYTVIKKKDKDGKEETVENLVNLDEKELDRFFPDSKSIFDKFFK